MNSEHISSGITPVLQPSGPMQVFNRGKVKASVAGVILMVLLSGCENVSKRHFTVGSVPDDYRSRHPIIISEKEKTLDVPVASRAYGLQEAQRSAVGGFSMRFQKSASGAVTVLIPSGSTNERAANRVAKKIVAELRKSGVPRNRIIMSPYFAENYGSSAPIRLSYSGIQASVEGCGQWPGDLAPDPDNKNYYNFGCATQNNLAAIVANPSDLLGPRGSTSIDAERRLKVIDAYRKAADPSTIYVAP